MQVQLLVGDRKGRFPGSNCLLIKGARTRVLVDAGCRRDQILGVKHSIDAVVYTHIHPDHITYHELLEGVASYIPAYDASFPTIQEMAKRYAPPYWRDWISYIKAVFNLESLPVAHKVYDAWEAIKIGDIVIDAIPAYGHTKGHHVFIIGDYVHLADIDLTSFGPWYGHPESSIENIIADIKMIYELDGKTYTTSHKELLYDPDEVSEALNKYKYALCRQFTNTLMVLKGLSPSTPQEMVNKGAIYKRKIPGAEKVMEYFEYEMITKILDFLLAKGIVGKNRWGYYLNRDIDEETCYSIL